MRLIRSHRIDRSRRTVLVSLAGAAATAAALSVAPAGTALAAPAASPMALAAGSVPMTLVHAASLRGGDVSTTWEANGAEVRSAGLPGSRVFLAITGRHSLKAWTDPPSAAAPTPEQYARSGRSVYWDALAAGMSKAEAIRTTLALGDRLPAAAHVSAIPKFRTPNIFNSVCTTATGYVDGHAAVFGTACLQQSYLESKPGAYYLDNQVTSTGYTLLTGFDDLTRLTGSYCWCNNGYTYTRVGWSPTSTITKGSPTTYTLSANWGGFSISVQEMQYPETLSPNFPSGISEPAFGSQWNGSNNNYTYDSANSVAIVHEGPGAPGPARVNVAISWVA